MERGVSARCDGDLAQTSHPALPGAAPDATGGFMTAGSRADVPAPWTRDVVLGTLAVWRLSHLLAHEDGPADVVATLRTRLDGTVLGRLLGCFFCLSLWVAAVVAPLVARRPRDLPLTCVALSGAACLLERAGDSEAVLDMSRIMGGVDDGVLRQAVPGRDGG
jgi:hypothetical protein